MAAPPPSPKIAMFRTLTISHDEDGEDQLSEKLYIDFLKRTFSIAEHCRRTNIHEGDVRYAAETLGFQLTVDTPSEIPNYVRFLEQTRYYFNSFKADVSIARSALVLLYAVREAIKVGSVTLTQAEGGRTLYLDSPTGVTALFFQEETEEEADEDDDDDTYDELGSE
jgi:hypothetical protein